MYLCFRCQGMGTVDYGDNDVFAGDLCELMVQFTKDAKKEEFSQLQNEEVKSKTFGCMIVYWCYQNCFCNGQVKYVLCN